MNIFSLIVRPQIEHLQSVKATIQALPGTEIHAEHEGRLIVVVEDIAGVRPTDTLTAIQLLPGVMSATLAYEYSDDEVVSADALPQPRRRTTTTHSENP